MGRKESSEALLYMLADYFYRIKRVHCCIRPILHCLSIQVHYDMGHGKHQDTSFTINLDLLTIFFSRLVQSRASELSSEPSERYSIYTCSAIGVLPPGSSDACGLTVGKTVVSCSAPRTWDRRRSYPIKLGYITY